uniref:PGG domain-containing protein n=1 Tax=Fagus sylvatica TaxID=28930 RepID=A0A2N9F9J5_FAGSY
MDERIERLKKVSQCGDIDTLYMLIQEDAYLLEHIDHVPFFDTPLHIAASMGHILFVMEMMRLKPSFARKPNPEGLSPIHLALINGHIEMVQWLLQVDGDLVCVKGREGMTLLHHAVATNDNLDLLSEFLSVCPNSIKNVTIRNETALHIALKYNKLEAFKLLVGWLGKNRSKNAMFWEKTILKWKDNEGNTVLHVAVVSHLLAWGGETVNVNLKNLEGKTAWDILQEQTQVDNSEIKALLRDARPFNVFMSSYTYFLYEKRNALLVVAVLLVSVTYQAVLNPPGGLWQEDKCKCDTVAHKAAQKAGRRHYHHNKDDCDPKQKLKAGTAIGLTTFPFWLFLCCNSVIFVVANSIIYLLVPVGYIRASFVALIIYLWFCYIASLIVITDAPYWTFCLVSFAIVLYTYTVLLRAFSIWTNIRRVLSALWTLLGKGPGPL